MQRIWMGLLVPLMMGAGGALAQHEGHMHHQDHAARPAESDATALYNAEDLQFLHHMSMHHQQALDMAALVPERTEHEAFKRFARYVARGQAAEIREMQALVELAAQRGLEAPHHHMDHDPPMAGMLSRAEMETLAASTGAEFERLWLQGMIFHHEGGLAMARAQQLQQLEKGRSPYGLQVMIEEILIEQRAEVTKMADWLADWGLVPANAGDGRTPAAEVVSPVPGAVLSRGEAVTLIGVAVDDRGIRDVRIGIQDTASKDWWQEEGRWGVDRTLHTARLARAGASSEAWTFDWMPTESGSYAVMVLAEDEAGKTGESPMARHIRVE